MMCETVHDEIFVGRVKGTGYERLYTRGKAYTDEKAVQGERQSMQFLGRGNQVAPAFVAQVLQ
eukprot:1159445-Pelagomonas_calceolata.AAC.6